MARIYSRPVDFQATDITVVTIDSPPSVTPVASFTMTPNPATGSPATVTLQDTSSNSPTLIEWDFTNNGTFDATNVGGGSRPVVYNPGTFTVRMRASNAAGSDEITQTLTVYPNLAITSQPSSTTVNAGASASFSVSAIGAPTITYQWQVSTSGIGGTYTNISGATNSTYTFTTDSADNGKFFRCYVSNPSGNLTSSPAGLSVNAAPVITGLTNQSAAIGSTVTFAPSYGGAMPITYQWQLSTNGGTSWSNISGATGSSYSFTVAAGDDSKLFRVRATNVAGTTDSNAVSVQPGLAITSQPTAQSANAGGTATYSVAVAGTAPYSYQWQVSTSGIGGPFNNVVGATNSSYTFTVGAGDNGRYYRVIVTHSGGAPTSVTSDAVILNVTTLPTISNLNGGSFAPGSTVTFNPTYGGAPTSYQWQRNGSNISGATSATYSFVMAAGDDGASFRVIATNGAGSTTSSSVIVKADLTIISHPADQTVILGNSATFSVVATGGAPLTYQWLRSPTGVGGMWSNIAGATGSTYTFTPTGSEDRYYACTISDNDQAFFQSNSALLTVNSLPTISSLNNQNPGVGGTASWNPTYGGTTPITYQWQRSTNGGASWLDIGGATSASFSVVIQAGETGYLYRVRATNVAGTTTSNSAAVSNALVITSQPSSITVNEGSGSVSFTVAATGSPPLSYQWQRNGVNIGGATGSTYSFTPTGANNGDTYRCVVSDSTAAQVTSDSATLTVRTAPVFTSHPAFQVIQTGGTANFSVTTSGTAPITYQWQVSTNSGGSWSNISGATSTTYSVTMSPALGGNQYRCVATNVVATVNSNAALLSLGLRIITQPSNQSVNAGQTASFSVVAEGTGTITYQWQRSTTGTGGTFSAIGGATSSTYSFTTSAGENGYAYRCVLSDANSVGFVSSAASLTVAGAPSISAITNPVVAATGATVTYNPVYGGTMPITYSWQQSADGVTNWNQVGTSASYSFTMVPGFNGQHWRVQATNVAGTTTSNVSLVWLALANTGQPSSQTIPVGGSNSGSVTFTSSWEGRTPITYQWQRSNNSGASWSNIAGATSAVYGFTAVSSDNGAQFRVLASNPDTSNLASSAATLTTITAPTVGTLSNQSVANNDTVTWVAPVTGGSSPLTYQWQVSTNGGASWSNVAGATGNSYSFTATTAQTGYLYRVQVANSAGSATTNSATLTVSGAAASGPYVSITDSRVGVGAPSAAVYISVSNAGQVGRGNSTSGFLGYNSFYYNPVPTAGIGSSYWIRVTITDPDPTGEGTPTNSFTSGDGLRGTWTNLGSGVSFGLNTGTSSIYKFMNCDVLMEFATDAAGTNIVASVAGFMQAVREV